MAESSSPKSTASTEIEYDQCYSADVFSKVAGTSFRKVDGIYVEQYGGGPQGGLLFSVNGNVYNVNREWCEPFTMKKIVGNPRFVVKSENPDLMRMLKDGEEPIEDEEIEFDCVEWHEVKWAQAKENYEEACLEAEASEESEEENIDMSKFLKDLKKEEQPRSKNHVKVVSTTDYNVPDDLDLHDKTQVVQWNVKDNFLYIEKADGSELFIDPRFKDVEVTFEMEGRVNF